MTLNFRRRAKAVKQCNLSATTPSRGQTVARVWTRQSTSTKWDSKLGKGIPVGCFRISTYLGFCGKREERPIALILYSIFGLVVHRLQHRWSNRDRAGESR